MRGAHVILGAAVLSAVPVGALLLLAALGEARPGPALVVCLATILAALAAALHLARDVNRLAEALRRAASGLSAVAPAEPSIGPLQALAAQARRLAREIASRDVLIEQLREVDNAIVARLPDPVILLGADRALRRANPAAVRTYGPELASLLRHPGLLGALDRAFADAAGGGVESVELSLPVPVPRDVFATVVVFDPPLPEGERALLMLADRTRERAAERTRSDFVANVSHELRTPLASLIGFIDTLRGPAREDPPAQQRFLGIMAEQAGRMHRLIDDLLSLSRIELTEHETPSESVDLAALLGRLAAAFEPRLAERQTTLRLEVPPGLPAVLGDADQLAQVAQNLLDNAVKYGRVGGEVRLSAAVSAPQGGPPTSGVPAGGGHFPARPGVVLSVADQGAGIARAHLPRLGERFYRVDRGRSRAVGGTGLGLAIVKHIVSRHRGMLHIDSIEGSGTTVSVWLPQAPPTARARPLAAD